MPDPVKEEVKDTTDWKAEAARRDEVIRSTQARNKQFEEELSKYKQADADRTAKETQTREEQERAKLAEQGKYQEAVKSVETKYQSEISNIFKTINEKYVPSAIKVAASKIKGLTPEAIEDLPSLVSSRVRIDPKTFETYVADEKGEPMRDEKMAPVSVESFIESFTKSRTYMFADTMPKGTGAQATSAGKAFTIEAALADPKVDLEWKKLDPEGYRAALTAYRREAPARAREQAQAKMAAISAPRRR